MKAQKHIYEIYTKNPKTGETGWDIKFVLATKDSIKSFPHFDVIISIDNVATQYSGPKVINWF